MQSSQTTITDYFKVTMEAGDAHTLREEHGIKTMLATCTVCLSTENGFLYIFCSIRQMVTLKVDTLNCKNFLKD